MEMISQFLKIIIVTALIVLTSGCGQMGPLYLPKDNQSNTIQKSPNANQNTADDVSKDS